MHVAVVGAGAIGAVVAAAAAGAAAGSAVGTTTGSAGAAPAGSAPTGGPIAGEPGARNRVTLCVRQPIDELVVETGVDVTAVPVQMASTPAGVSPVDVVFVTVKVTDNPSVGPWLSALCSPDTLVVAVQNGLDHAVRLAPYTPAGIEVVPGLAYLAAERIAPGRVRHLAGNLLVVPAEAAPRVDDAVGPALQVRGTDDVLTACWQKLLGNLVANPLTALTMRRIDVLGEPAIADMARAMLREAVAVGRASGAALSDEDVERVVVGTGRYGAGTGSSMFYDRLAGRPLEHQFLTGEVVRRGAEIAIPTPLNSAVLALLDALDRSRSGS